MAFLPNDIELKVSKEDKLTVYVEDTGHYALPPQRGCFVRCEQCVNLREADSYEEQGKWYFKPECYFCVQRVIDLLGFYEHGKAPTLQISPSLKTRERRETGGILEALRAAADGLEL